MTQFQILVSTYTDEIYTLLFDDVKGSLEVVSEVKVGHHPSWITFHPEDRSIVFTGLEQSDGVAVALRFDNQGKGEVIGRTGSGGRDPCSLLVNKDELLIANVSEILKSCKITFCTVLTGAFFQLSCLMIHIAPAVLLRNHWVYSLDKLPPVHLDVVAYQESPTCWDRTEQGPSGRLTPSSGLCSGRTPRTPCPRSRCRPGIPP